jgi:hypothetical protein
MKYFGEELEKMCEENNITLEEVKEIGEVS